MQEGYKPSTLTTGMRAIILAAKSAMVIGGKAPALPPPLVLCRLPPLVILAIGPTRTILRLDPALLGQAGGLSKPLCIDCIYLKKSRAANLTRKP